MLAGGLCAAQPLVSAAAREGAPFEGAVADRAIAGVAVGQSLGAARDRLADLAAREGLTWVYEPAFMVDFSANCLARGDIWLFCGLVYEDPAYDAAAEIVALVALDAELSTPDGVRVGMRLSAVEPIWGAPTLSFSYENEAREFIAFPAAPQGLAARGASASHGAEAMGYHVGLYAQGTRTETYQETTAYRSDAVIGSLWVN